MKLSSFKNFIIKKLDKNIFLRNVLFASGGAAIAQGLNFLFSPVITRMYSPNEYGLMAVFTSVLMILSFTSLMYEMAIPLEKDDNNAINVAALSFFILSIFILILSILLIFNNDFIFNYFNIDELIPYKFLIVLGIFFVGSNNILIFWMYRRKNFSLISLTQVNQSLSGNMTKIGLGYFGFGATGLLIGTIIKYSAGVFTLIRNFLKKDKSLLLNISFKRIVQNTKKYKNFPIYQTPSMILLRLKNQVPIFALAFYGTKVVGLFGFAYTITKLPMILVGQSLRNVFFAEAANIGKDNPKKLNKLSNSLFKKMAVFGFIPMLVVIIFGPKLFSLFFGKDWYQSGVFSSILAISIYADLIFSPASRVYEVLERQKFKVVIDLIGLILIIVSFIIARFFDLSPIFAILLYSISMFIIYMTTFIIAKILLRSEIIKSTNIS